MSKSNTTISDFNKSEQAKKSALGEDRVNKEIMKVERKLTRYSLICFYAGAVCVVVNLVILGVYGCM